jgi:hypothetical protein
VERDGSLLVGLLMGQRTASRLSVQFATRRLGTTLDPTKPHGV